MRAYQKYIYKPFCFKPFSVPSVPSVVVKKRRGRYEFDL